MFNKNIMMSLGVGALALTMSTSEAYANETGTVTCDVLNVRSGASTNSSIISKLYRGNTVNIIESSNGWYKITLSNGSTGWVSDDYVSKTTNSNQTTSGYGKVTASSLNVRSGASTSHSIITKLSSGTIVEIIGSSNGWSNIKLSNGTTGWVSGSYLTQTSAPQAPSTPDSGQATFKYGKVTASSLNVRSGASTSHSIISKLSSGTVVEVISKSNGWFNIKLSNGTTGWVSDDYLVETSNKPSNDSTSPSGLQGAVINLAMAQIGKPYVWGAEGPNAFDCSGFSYYVFKNAAGITLPRTSASQANFGTYVAKSNLQPGDLIFTGYNGSVSHVGIYIGNDQFIHSPNSNSTVRIDSINASYWSNRYITARRVL